MKQQHAFYPIITAALLFAACSGATGSSDGSKDPAAGTSGSGGDMYYEYTITTNSKDININGHTKMYVSAHGECRVEMDMANPVSKTKDFTMVLLANINKPNESISLDDDNKTYSINDINPDSLAALSNGLGKMTSTVTKVGEEKVAGYSCVHARVISTRNIGGFYKTVDTIDLWRSKDVPMQSGFSKLMDLFESKTGNMMYDPGTTSQLKQMGCDGFMVKIEMRSKYSDMNEVLTKAEHGDFAKSMFAIPAGYKQVDNALFNFGPGAGKAGSQ